MFQTNDYLISVNERQRLAEASHFNQFEENVKGLYGDEKHFKLRRLSIRDSHVIKSYYFRWLGI